MNERLYYLASDIFSPPLVAAYMVIILSLITATSAEAAVVNSAVGIGLLSFIPMSVFLYRFKKGKIDFEISDRKMRYKIYLTVLLSLFIAMLVFEKFANRDLFVLSASYFVVTLFVFSANFFSKISAHAAGIAGPTTALVFVFGINLLPLYILTFLVSYVRLKLHAHNTFQLTAGAVLGIVLTYITYSLLW